MKCKFFSGSGRGSGAVLTRVADPHSFHPDPHPEHQGFKDQKLKKITAKIKFIFLDQKLQFTYSQASTKNVQVTEEAFSSQKRTSNT
jgi:hypothetical protein